LKYISGETGMEMDTSEKYARYCKPKLLPVLQSVRLDIEYVRGEGDYLYYRDAFGRIERVLDFLGGYGSTLFGHNHPALVEAARASLDEKTPFSAQASCRGGAARLCEKLDGMMHRRTGRHFVTTLASTGAECVEAAIKHAEMSHYTLIQGLYAELSEKVISMAARVREGSLELPRRTADEIRSRTGAADDDVRRILWSVLGHNRALFSAPPYFLALEKSFHGKTTGSVQLTHYEDYRAPFLRIGFNVIFVPVGDVSALEKAVRGAAFPYLWLEENDRGEIVLVEREHVNISAMFVEPIQGEGGVHVIPDEVMRACREMADRGRFPLIFDEIQCGMGRTGSFLYSERSGIIADYYLLSKSLGGGLSKISAMMVSRDLYQPDFGLIHSSTFAEDDHSARIALAALGLLDGDPSVMRNCAERGVQLKRGIEGIRDEFPGVIREVRGEGLMLGMQFESQERSGSVTMRVISGQNLLGPVAAGYLLHEHRIRVAPALSQNATIRIEPSAFVTERDCERFIAAVRRLCEIIYKQNAFALTRFIVGSERTGVFDEVADCRRERPAVEMPEGGRSVAFIGHYITSDHLAQWDESLANFSPDELDTFMEKLHAAIGPWLTEKRVIKSLTGDSVMLNFIGVFLDSKRIAKYMMSGDLSPVRLKVREAVDIAIAEGCRVVGFGGFTSIVTHNCTDIVTDAIALTSGNSFTTAMGIEAITRSAADAGIELETSCLAAIGATGNICSVYSEIMAERVPRVILIGRVGSEKRLRDVASSLCYNAFMEVLACASGVSARTGEAQGRVRTLDRLSGVAGAIIDTECVRELLGSYREAGDIGGWLFDRLSDEMGGNAPVRISTDYSSIREANLIVGASNSPGPVIMADMLGEGPIVICDIAVPMDTDESVMRERSDVSVMLGGIVRLPFNPDFRINGIPLDYGQSFACMAETTLLGLTGIGEHYSYGRIDKLKVKKILEIARIHGFSLARVKTERSY
jgi:acetylornithine/succinyldiaminopimelate/putrescine aminotransferase/predicted amino acid dehydrogenase